MENFNLDIPINGLSLGNCSVNILKELYKRGQNPTISLVGEKADFSTFEKSIDLNFISWVKDRALCFQKKHRRDNPTLKLWHINGSMSSQSKEQVLFTFYELDSPTECELNILKNQKRVLVSSNYTKTIFENSGCSNIEYCPLGFDSESFFKKEKRQTGVITFGLAGKLEKRKQHHKVLKAWAKKYGNNPKYALNCAIKNPFLTNEQNINAVLGILEGVEYFNINMLDFMPTNLLYNDYLNNNNIIIGMSSGEGWGLPEFQSLCLGKHAVILNAHSYKDWANKENSVLVNPTSKIECYDGLFFRPGSDFNQGSYFDWNEDDFLDACEEAEKRFLNNNLNENGEKLIKQFTWSRTVDTILKSLT